LGFRGDKVSVRILNVLLLLLLLWRYLLEGERNELLRLVDELGTDGGGSRFLRLLVDGRSLSELSVLSLLSVLLGLGQLSFSVFFL